MTIRLIACLLASWVALQGTSPRYLIELAEVTRSTDEEMSTVPESEQVGSPNSPFAAQQPPRLPFSVEALELERTAYNIGDPFLYEVTLRYLGSEAFQFPVSTKKHLVRKSMPGLHKATISLEIDDAVLGHQIIESRALYGADEVVGSLVTLTNNQTVRIRGDGRWQFSWSPSSLPSTWSRAILPFVELRLDYAPQSYQGVRSASIAVQLERTQ